MKREDGFYWVLTGPLQEWSIALWEDGGWDLMRNPTAVNDDHFYKIGAIINRMEALRTAPETVSLEGVRTWTWEDLPGEPLMSHSEEYALVSDLRRLVAPIQGGGVDLHDFYLWRRALGFDDRETMAEDYSTDEIDVVEKIRELLTTTQTPVQSGGVEELRNMVLHLSRRLSGLGHDASEGFSLAHLTTTQSAPVADHE